MGGLDRLKSRLKGVFTKEGREAKRWAKRGGGNTLGTREDDARERSERERQQQQAQQAQQAQQQQAQQQQMPPAKRICVEAPQIQA